MGYIEVGPNGEIALPKEVRDRLGLKPGDRVRIDVADDGTAIVAPRRRRAADLFGCLPRPDRPLSVQEMDEAIAGAAVERAKRA
ncbi:AbrB/MazE/SpoVT family DNA-binding domain-containing protein [Azospirillum halopraeferens]|uniref:AbrB/MazE/SpoVT family DNA-binding domain-containing protein n=1 Tax=Azospirillum halopraeferens TaxID=34010 RepID=UPI000400FA34|nr:AbrB/MazE/SpoVT family DNA-binding domain-containing protein [Azospirillum halopraeferens]